MCVSPQFLQEYQLCVQPNGARLHTETTVSLFFIKYVFLTYLFADGPCDFSNVKYVAQKRLGNTGLNAYR